MRKKIFLLIIILTLLLPVISVYTVGNAQGKENIIIGVQKGYDFGEMTEVKRIHNVLNNYSWVVNDTEYNFTTKNVLVNDNNEDKLKPINYQVVTYSPA